MSVCYNINCHDCKVALWVAQGGSCFYSGEPKTMQALGEFLFEHQGHALSFDDDNKFDMFDSYVNKGLIQDKSDRARLNGDSEALSTGSPVCE